MHDIPATWVTRAWQHWHRPWAVTHPDWLDASHARAAADEAQELILRLHYRAWCERYAIAPVLREFDDTPWWRLFGLPVPLFDACARRIGLALAFAAQPRMRLARRPGDDATFVRWSLQQAGFVSAAACDALRHAQLADVPMQYAALSLQWNLADAHPELWDRLRLRLAREHLPGQASLSLAPRPDPDTCAGLAALWSTGVRAVLKERLA